MVELMQLPTRTPLWRATSWARQRVAATQSYGYDNRQRGPGTVCVLQYSVAGSLIFERDGREQQVPPEHVMLFRWEQASSYRKPPGRAYACQWLTVVGAGVVEHWQAFVQRFGSAVRVPDPAGWQREMDLAFDAFGRQGELSTARHAAVVHQLVMRLFELAHRGASRQVSHVDQAIEHLLTQPTTQWSVAQLAAHFGCSREHLTRTFQQRTGKTPQQHLTDARLRRAVQLLRNTDLPIRLIARQCGFGTAHTLRRHMQQTHGMPPGAWRRQARSMRSDG